MPWILMGLCWTDPHQYIKCQFCYHSSKMLTSHSNEGRRKKGRSCLLLKIKHLHVIIVTPKTAVQIIFPFFKKYYNNLSSRLKDNLSQPHNKLCLLSKMFIFMLLSAFLFSIVLPRNHISGHSFTLWTKHLHTLNYKQHQHYTRALSCRVYRKLYLFLLQSHCTYDYYFFTKHYKVWIPEVQAVVLSLLLCCLEAFDPL